MFKNRAQYCFGARRVSNNLFTISAVALPEEWQSCKQPSCIMHDAPRMWDWTENLQRKVRCRLRKKSPDEYTENSCCRTTRMTQSYRLPPFVRLSQKHFFGVVEEEGMSPHLIRYSNIRWARISFLFSFFVLGDICFLAAQSKKRKLPLCLTFFVKMFFLLLKVQ